MCVLDHPMEYRIGLDPEPHIPIRSEFKMGYIDNSHIPLYIMSMNLGKCAKFFTGKVDYAMKHI